MRFTKYSNREERFLLQPIYLCTEATLLILRRGGAVER